MNLLLTNRCVRECPYCFAKRELHSDGKGDYFSWENLIYITDFMVRSGRLNISLLGGEPTMHPDFVDFVLYLAERHFTICVFTSGILSERKLRDIETYLQRIPPGPLIFVCNLNNPQQTPAGSGEQERLHQFLSVMGPWIGPGFNIYRPDFNLEFIFDLVGQYGLRRVLRLGVAHPIPGISNSYIRPDQYGEVINRLCSFQPLFDRFQVKIGLDCGFPQCKFSNEQLGWLNRLFPSGLRFGCGAAAIDVTPDMDVYSCFPLSRVRRRSLFEFNSLQEIIDYYTSFNHNLRNELPGIYEECENCLQRQEHICSGGGACHLMNQMNGEAAVRLPEIEHAFAQIDLSRHTRVD